VKLPLGAGETRCAEPVQQHAPPVRSIFASTGGFFAPVMNWTISACWRKTNPLVKKKASCCIGDKSAPEKHVAGSGWELTIPLGGSVVMPVPLSACDGEEVALTRLLHLRGFDKSS